MCKSNPRGGSLETNRFLKSPTRGGVPAATATLREAARAGLEPLEARYLLTTYYVSTGGSDGSAGTSDAAAFATLQHAADKVKAGDTVIVRAGTYASGFAIGYNTPQAGTAAAPIQFLADPGVLVTGKAPHTSSSYLSAIDISNGCDYVTVSGFTMNDALANMSGAGIWVTNSAHVTLTGNTCTGTAKWGILTGFCDYLDIEHNTLSGVGQHGIYIGNACTSPVVMYNTSFNNGRSGIQLNGDKQENPATTGIIDHATIEFNVCYNDALTSSAAAISLDGTQDSVIGDNLLYDNHGNGIVLFPADGGTLNGGVDPASSNNLIVDNTVANTKYWSIQIIWGSTGNVVLDNVLWSDSAFGSYGSIECDAASQGGFHSDYNLVEGTNPTNGAFNTDANDGVPLSFAQWKASTGQDAHSIALTSGAAAFAAYASPTSSSNDYHPKAGGPAVDTGAAALAGQNALPTDLDGNPRPQGAGYDIGAY
ncbi:MAG TPA: right-handed parallel beta-helix repeat-containing protein, partial [Tepidisphaeraceae bacterium]